MVTQGPVDRLDALLNHFPVRARAFHAGHLCGITDFAAQGATGQLHLVRSGAMEVLHPGGSPTLRIDEPSLLMYPRPLARRFVTDRESGSRLACAELQFEGGAANPLLTALPDVVTLPLRDIAGADTVLDLLFDEAFSQNCGRQTLLDRLFEVVLVQVLRQLMEAGRIRSGMLTGLAHPRLRNALVAMHERPAEPWSLETLADEAGMSRTSFAATFRHVVGCTPGAYLQRWRIRLAQQALVRGLPMKIIAGHVGYGSEAALSRAFRAQCGVNPRQWRRGGAGPGAG